MTIAEKGCERNPNAVLFARSIQLDLEMSVKTLLFMLR